MSSSTPSLLKAWRGRLFGLVVHSELPLPFAQEPSLGTEKAEVQIRFGKIAPADNWLTRRGQNGLQFEIGEVGRFMVTDGREIIIDPSPGVSERNLRVYLLGSGFGAILHQRGVFPLHANAVVIEGRAIAFVGRSGAGKSTLAAWFQAQGDVVLADDVCAVAFSSDGLPMVLPGVPRLRLWKDALEHTGHDTADFERSFDGEDKYDVPAPLLVAQEASPLAACYWLDEPETDTPLRIDRLGGAEAVEMLMTNTFRGRFVPLLGRSAPHMRSCVELAAKVPVFRAIRRKNRDEYDSVARRLRKHALSVPD